MNITPIVSGFVLKNNFNPKFYALSANTIQDCCVFALKNAKGQKVKDCAIKLLVALLIPFEILFENTKKYLKQSTKLNFSGQKCFDMKNSTTNVTSFKTHQG